MWGRRQNMGRKRLYSDNAAKQKAYRDRKQGNPDTTVKAVTSWITRKFVGIDGEGKDIEGMHCYTMLTASDGVQELSITAQGNYLSTTECLAFLMLCKKKWYNSWFVGFSFNYDVNMILSDLNDTELV